jgi:hypothetical protein
LPGLLGIEKEGNGMTDETRIALLNYDWLIRERGLDDVQLAWNVETVIYGSGGAVMDVLCERGFTPATDGPLPVPHDYEWPGLDSHEI